MKRTLRASSRIQARRRERRRTAGYLLTLNPRTEFDADVLYTEAAESNDARTYPDALGGSQTLTPDTCALLPLSS